MVKKTIFLHLKKRLKLFCIINVFFMIPTSSFGVSFISWNSEEDLFSVQYENTTVKDILDYIEKHSKYIFIYSEVVQKNLNNKVSISVSNKKIDAILNELFSKTGLNYKMSGRQITISVPEQAPAIKQVKGFKVVGNVTDEKGEPLIGVSIFMKTDSTVNAITDMNGAYSIAVPDKYAELSFRYIGFVPKNEKVDNRRVLNVIMVEDVGQLDEVVVVAYGAQKKESVVGSITTIEPAKLNVSTSRSLSNNLAGTVTGVIGVQRSGEPGYDNSSFWIRGISTFQDVGKDPLVLVDGIERSLDNIDVEEIESFSVLKDAAASAVYGVRGANGVILINTKRGHVGKPRVVVKSEFAFTQPIKLPNYIGAADYMQLLDDVLVDTGQSPMYADRIAKTRAGYDPDLYPDVNWIDAISRDHAANQRVTVDVSGGSENLRYSFVAAVYNERGILTRDKSLDWDPTIKLQRYNVRSNVDLKLSPTTQVRFNIGGYLQDRNSSPESTDQIFSRAFRFTPFMFPTRYSSGEIPAWQEEGNPWAMATQRGFARSSASKIETLFSLEQDLKFLTPGLKLRGTFSFDRYSTGKVTRSKTIEYWNAASGRNEEGELILALKQQGSNFLGTSTSAEYGNKSIYMEASLNYDRTFVNKHAVSAMLLFNRRHYDDGAALPYRNQGLAGRTSYTYNGRYVAEFNFGYNGTENFAKGKRYGFFPSAAVGWIVSEESFMQPLRNTISKLKLRASYGQVGNANLQGRRFAYISTILDQWDDVPYLYRWGLDGDYGRNGMVEGDFGIPDLTWEIVNKANVGLELGLFNGMVDLQVDLFDERRNNILVELNSIPATSGFYRKPWSNRGKVKNQGAEVTLNFNKQIGKDFFLGLMGSFTYAHNEIIDKDEPLGTIGTTRAETGHPVGQLFGYVHDRLFTEDDFTTNAAGEQVLKEGIPTQTFTAKVRPGDIKYVDLDQNGVIDTYDQMAIGGTENPEIVYGFGVNLRWKDLDFGAMFQGIGRTWRILSSNIMPASNKGSMYNIFDNYQDRWTVDNQSQDVLYPRAGYGPNANNSQKSTWWLRNMSFLRLKNVELGYSCPKKWLQGFVISNARVFVRGTNLLTFSKFDLWDPELATGDGAKYPAMKSVSVGFDITF